MSSDIHYASHHRADHAYSIVIITSLVVAGTAAAVSTKFDAFSRVGGIIGSSVSAAFLIVLGIMNIYILYKLVRQLQRAIASDEEQDVGLLEFYGGGCLFSLFKGLFRMIDRYVVHLLRKASLIHTPHVGRGR